MENNWVVREAERQDLNGLLKLYTQLHQNPLPEIEQSLLQLWDEILQDRRHHIFLIEKSGKVISSCVMAVIPNLTHNQQPYALIENVVTDQEYRKKGCASAVLAHAKKAAEENMCYKIMLMTGSKEKATLRFYERSGYNRIDKTAFIQWL